MGSNIDPNKAIGQTTTGEFVYTERDSILYNLGVGVSTTQPDHLKFLFELSDDFAVLPTFGVIPAFGSLKGMGSGQYEGLQINPMMILHGEQYLELYKPFNANGGKLRLDSVISDVIDKGSGAVIYNDVTITDERGEKVAFNQFVTFVQKAGGFGGKRNSPKAIPTANPPKRAPDASITEKTTLNQAALYRLSGDPNPLHIDPSFSAVGGFPKPILHGLCTFGFSARHVLKQFADNDVTKFKAIKVRFTKPVIPGQSITTEMWKEGSRVFFQTKVAETGAVVLSGAYVDLNEGGSSGSSQPSGGPQLPSDAIFEGIKQNLSADLVKKVNGVFQFNITQGGKQAAQWTVDLKNGSGSVQRGPPSSGKADVTLTLSDDDFIQLASGKLNGQQAFLSGKLKVAGNIMLSQKLSAVFQQQSKL